MYSWVASFFTESEDGQIIDEQQTLYAEQQKRQKQDNDGGNQLSVTKNTNSEEWTWIEIIEDRDDHALIFVQSDESLRQKNAAAADISAADVAPIFDKRGDLAKTLQEILVY